MIKSTLRKLKTLYRLTVEYKDIGSLATSVYEYLKLRSSLNKQQYVKSNKRILIYRLPNGLHAIVLANPKYLRAYVATESNGIEIRRVCYEHGLKCNVIETGYLNRCITENIGILRSKGEPIAILEDDVVLEPDRLTKMVIALVNDKDVGCAYSAVINPFGSESLAIKTNKRAVHFIVKALNTLRIHNRFARKNLNVFSLSVICRKEALLKARLFDMNVEEPIVAEDYDLAIRVQKAGFKVITVRNAKAYHYSRHAYKRTLLALDRGPRW